MQVMKITKNIGMLLLAIYLILDGLLGFGLNLGPAIFLLYLVALAAGVLILIGKKKYNVTTADDGDEGCRAGAPPANQDGKRCVCSTTTPYPLWLNFGRQIRRIFFTGVQPYRRRR